MSIKIVKLLLIKKKSKKPFLAKKRELLAHRAPPPPSPRRVKVLRDGGFFHSKPHHAQVRDFLCNTPLWQGRICHLPWRPTSPFMGRHPLNYTYKYMVPIRPPLTFSYASSLWPVNPSLNALTPFTLTKRRIFPDCDMTKIRNIIVLEEFETLLVGNQWFFENNIVP